MSLRHSVTAILMMAAAESGLAQDISPSRFTDVNRTDSEISLGRASEDLLPGYAPYEPVSFLQNQTGNQQPGGAAATQPQPALRPNPQPAQNPLLNAQNRRPTLARLSRAPDLFGDSFTPLTVGVVGQNLSGMGITSNFLDGNYEANVPLGGGTRRFKNEQTRAMPTDRVLFVYNHFHNAVELKHVTGTGNRADVDHVDQYTLGFEKTFDDGNWSLEARMPVAGDSDLAIDNIQINSGSVGNLALTLKRLLYTSDEIAIAAGLAVTAPTGSDTDFVIQSIQSRFQITNEAVHLLPYVAVQFAPDENWFFHAFAQVDVAANSNSVSFSSPLAVPQTQSGSISEQTLMYLDVSAGYWWYRTEDDDALTGLASVLEFHYTSSLNDASSTDIGNAGFFNVGNGLNRFDVVNMTVGLHSEWWKHTALRTALVVPLGNEQDRFFDSEIQVSLIRRF